MNSMTQLNLVQARTIIAAAHAGAAQAGIASASVVVTDAGGAIRAAERGDTVGTFGVSIATAKARTALGFGRSSVKLAAVFGDKPAVVTGLAGAVGGDFLPLGGGVVIVDAADTVIGAAAIAGGAPDVDHAVITAAVEAAGLKPRE
jgi:uncharacterized protein GlcG (DUF336 family)